MWKAYRISAPIFGENNQEGSDVVEIEILNAEKMVLVWASNDDQKCNDFDKDIKNLGRSYGDKKYRIIVMRSGCNNLIENTQGLLQANL